MRLIAEDIACQRGGREVFTGLSFAVDKGQSLLVTGRNGAGKSSLLRIIAGLVRLAAGRLSLEGSHAQSSLAEQAHYVGHQDPVKGALSVAENLGFWSAYLGGKPDVRGALKAVGLDALADLPAAYLSAGQRRRLSIARLVAVKRPLWLLDEPTTALDAEAQKALAGLMRKHLRSGGLIVTASHGPIGISGAKQLRLGRA